MPVVSNPEIDKRIFVVLGMHRSGTSAVTRSLQVLGVDLGDDLLPPNEDNLKGFWEDSGLYTLNMEMLEVLGMDWHFLMPVSPGDLQRLEELGYARRALELLRDKAGNKHLFGLKDPRIARLLPFWKRIFDQCEADVSYVLVIRNPLSVARSLKNRNGFDAERSYLLWLGYVVESLTGTAGETCVVVDFDSLMTSPGHEIGRVARYLGLDIDKAALENYENIYLDEKLRHSCYTLDNLLLEDSCPPVVKDIYSVMRDVAADKIQLHNVRFREKMQQWTEEFKRIEPSLVLADRLFVQQQDAVRTVYEREAHIKNLERITVEQSQKIEKLDTVVAENRSRIEHIHHAVSDYENSTSWKLTAPLRAARRRQLKLKRAASLALHGVNLGGGWLKTASRIPGILRSEGYSGIRRRIRNIGLNDPRFYAGEYEGVNGVYQEWVRQYDTITEDARTKFREAARNLARNPLISVVMPVYNSPADLLDRAIHSVRNQLYEGWELCIADDCSTDREVIEILRRHASEDQRIRVIYRKENGHISAASNSALEMVKGEYVALLDHDDMLSEHALFWVASEINAHPDARVIYSDEDKIGANGVRQDPYFKCDWNPDLFLSHNMISHLGVYSSSLVREAGGFRVGMEGSQDYDLALRCVERVDSRQIRHIPRILYHWQVLSGSTALNPAEKPYALLAGERAINEFLIRNGIDARAELQSHAYRIRYEIPEPGPRVSVVVPTRNGVDVLRVCINSVLEKTGYENYEILVVDNGSDEAETLDYLENIGTHDRITVLRDARPFNYSALNNLAVENATGSIIGLLNNDIEVINPEWMTELVSHACRREIGAVGAKLLYPDGSSQHSGVILGIQGVANHAFKGQDRSAPGYMGRGQLIQSLSAVTAACLFVRKEVYEEVGGLNEVDLAVAFNDVDFCLRITEKGYRNIWTPYAELYHHESKTRGFEDTPEKQARFKKEVEYMRKRWGKLLDNDPAYNPNLTLDRSDFSIAFPPRIQHLV